MFLGLAIVIAAGVLFVVNKLRSTHQDDLKDTVTLLSKQVKDLERRMKLLSERVDAQPGETKHVTHHVADPVADPTVESQTAPLASEGRDLPTFNPAGPHAPASPPAAPVELAETAKPANAVKTDLATLPASNVLDAINNLKAQRLASEQRAAMAKQSAQAPSAKTTVEERLGAGVFIWVGGISLILAGAFLVKYSFDNNLITPLMRVLLGTAFGFVLLAAAQFMHKKSRKIASSLAGAAVADLFACLLAANAHYEMIGSTTAFILMFLLTGLAILLSLRHGRLVAILGLVGGFITPAIIGTGTQQVGPLLAYLMLLQIAMTLVSGRRAWVGMTTLTMAGGVVWALVLLFSNLTGSHRFMLELFLIGSAVLYILSASRLASSEREAKQNSPLDTFKIALSSVSAAVVLIAVLVYQGKFGVMDLTMLGLLGAALLVLARLRPTYGTMAWLSGGVSLCTLFAWVMQTYPGGRGLPVQAFWITTLSYGVLYALGSYILMWRSKNERYWATGSVIAAIAFFLMAMGALESVDYNEGVDILPWLQGDYDWAVIAGVLGLLYALLAYPVWRARLLYLQGNAALGMLVSASAIFFALAAQRGLGFPWQLSVWASLAAALAYLVRWQRILYLRNIAAALGLLTTIFLLLPGASGMAYGQRVLINIILPAYAVPAIALGLAAWCLRAKRDAKEGHLLQLLAILIAAVGSLALVRHGFHPVRMHMGDVSLYEWATYSVVALSLGHGLLLWHRWCPGWPQQAMAAILLVLGVFDVIIGAGVIANPLWHNYSVGSWPVLNGLLFVYGVPAVLIALLFFNRPHTKEAAIQKAVSGLLGCVTFVLVFALVSLQVRQYFHHPMLNTDGVSNPEMYSYSVAWIILGIVLVAMGIRFKSRSIRYASLAVMLIAIGKVFLLDTAHLEDLYRVISFLGLGITLMVLGYVYQRFVFKKAAVEM